MQATLIQNIDGQLIRTDIADLDTQLAAFEVRGFELTGFNSNPRQRAELQGAPTFKGLCGPMWDGDRLRYESTAAYAVLSA